MYTPNRDDGEDEDGRVSRHIAANIVANGGRFYEDETWASAETPAPYLSGSQSRPQTGYESGRQRNFRDQDANGGQNNDDDDDYTYANEANDEGSMMDSAYIAALAASASASSRRRSGQASSKASTPSTELEDDDAGGGGYHYPNNDDVPDHYTYGGADDRFDDNDDGHGHDHTEEEEEASFYEEQHRQYAVFNNENVVKGGDQLPPGITARDQAEDEAAMLRMLAHQLDRGWGQKADEDYSHLASNAPDDNNNAAGGGGPQQPMPPHAISPSLERRLRDFRFAQNKRRDRYGNERPWGILGLYDHLLGVRIDVEWSEDAAWRREHGEPYLSWADFEDSRNSGFNRPWFTYFILVVCTAVLIASIGVNGWKVEPMSVNPMIGPSAETLVKMGAKQTTLIVVGGEWYRLFSPMVLHAGLIHYLLNMLALWFIGSAVEQAHGYLSAFIIFFISAVGGNILSAIFLPEYISVGASGGIFGLIGACVADIAINWRLLFSKEVNKNDSGTRLRHFKVLVWLVFDILINCLIGLTPFVDNFTHLGGMVYGFLCGLSAIERLPLDFFGKAHSTCSKIRNYSVRFFGLILSVVLIMVSTALLVESDGGSSPCSNCRYVSCVPFPFWEARDNKWWYCDDCDRVKGDVTKTDATGYYDVLTLTCPNGATETIDLSGQNISDSEWLRNQLPTFCRQNCESLFA